jgi:hypothetical protein
MIILKIIGHYYGLFQEFSQTMGTLKSDDNPGLFDGEL